MKTGSYDVATAFSDCYDLVSKKPVWVLVWGLLAGILPLLPLVPVLILFASNPDVWLEGPETLGDFVVQNTLSNLPTAMQMIAYLFVSPVIIRMVLGKQEGSRFFGMRLSMDEVWNLVAWAFIYALMTAAILVVSIVALLVAGISSLVAGKVAAVLIGIVVFCLLMIPMLWASVRLSLLPAACVDLKTLALSQAWKASSGRFWPLFGTWVLVALIALAVSIAWMLFMAVLAVILFGIGSAMGAFSFEVDPNYFQLGVLAVIGVMLALLPTAFMTGVGCILYSGPFASAWRQLNPVQTNLATNPIADPMSQV